MKRKSYNLYMTLLLSMIFCVLSTLMFLWASISPKVSSLVRAGALERVDETIRQSAQGFARYTDSLQNTLQHALSLMPSDPKGSQGWRVRLNYLKESVPGCTALAVFDADGEPLHPSPSEVRRPAREIRQSGWFLDALRREGLVTCFSAPHVQALFRGRYDDVITLSRAFSYTEKEETKQGVMMMDISLERFSRLTSGVRLGKSGYAYVVGPDDGIITHPRLAQIDLDLFSEDSSPVRDTVVGLAAARKDGRDRVYIIRSLDRTRWRMVGVAYTAELMGLQSTLRSIFGVAMLSSALVSVGAALVLARLMTSRLEDVKRAILRVKQGDLDATLSESGFTEINLIAGSFNDMLAQLKRLMAQIVREQETKRLYELNALQAQINPHFLYNTLDSIIWMAERGRTRETVQMVSALARLFRLAISKGKTEITVKEELEHVRNYLIIQKMRFKEKFEYDLSCSDDAAPLPTVKLIIQPLVENALNHAMNELSGECLHIAVAAFVNKDGLFFTVRDDGIGMPPEKVEGLLTQPGGRSGIGLKNVHERIRLTYGAPYGLTVRSREDEGTLITVRLPKDKEEQA